MKTHLILTALLLVAPMAMLAQKTAKQTWKPGLNPVQFEVEGTPVVGTLFLPASYKAGDKLPAVLVDGPWTQVKEQVGYRYGQAMAERGFAALAIDHRNFGESGGKLRQYESPTMKVTDLKAAVTYLIQHPAVDGKQVNALGVCFGATYLGMTVAEDSRIARFATVAAWLHDAPSLTATYGADGVQWRRERGEKALAQFRNTGTVEYIPAYSASDTAAMMIPNQAPWNYYGSTERGVIPQWKNEFAVMSWVDWLKLDAIDPLAPRIKQPTLVVHSDNSALPDNARRFHSLLAGPKQLVWTEGYHFDFYDHQPHISQAADAVAAHFRKPL